MGCERGGVGCEMGGMTILQLFFSLFCISEISLQCHNSALHRRDLEFILASQSLVFISPMLTCLPTFLTTAVGQSDVTDAPPSETLSK